MSNEKEFDTSWTDNVVCPYCGSDNGADEGDGPPSGEQQCCECEKFFDCEPDYSVTYSTSKMDCRNGIVPHKWEHRAWESDLAAGGAQCWRCSKCNKVEWREDE